MVTLAKFFRLSWSDRALLVETVFWLGAARLAICILPFKRIAPSLGKQWAETPSVPLPGDESLPVRVSWAVTRMSRRVPWESACLTQAIAAKMILRRRGLPSTLYLGTADLGKPELQSHAWLRCGNQIVTGGAGRERFAIVSTFAEEGI